jgi:hypothetical protein
MLHEELKKLHEEKIALFERYLNKTTHVATTNKKRIINFIIFKFK